MLIGDERRLKQVLINLVKNAIKFTSSGSISIKASYNRIERELVIHIKDTGTGIDEKDFSKLFCKFGKLQRTS